MCGERNGLFTLDRMDSRLYIYNTLTKKKEPFSLPDEHRVRMFTCGPSVYHLPHIGNYATFLYEDVVQRYLEYLGYQVDRLINVTDLEDKTIAESQEQGVTLEKITKPIEEAFLHEAGRLSINLPRRIPSSTTSVDQAVELIKILFEKRYAYWHDGDVFYQPTRFPGFGKLYGLDMSRWPKKPVRFRRDTYPGQRWNLGDFILWHGYRKAYPVSFYWDTEIGKGRPSWNIQDPAIITKHFGYHVDIFCGGIDNLYRHHDYIIAVMEAVSGEEFCHYWLHGEHVLLNGSKMSKSKGNVIYPHHIYAQGYAPADLRFFLINRHYRAPIDIKRDLSNVAAAGERRRQFQTMLSELMHTDLTEASRPAVHRSPQSLYDDFEKYMNDDLNVEKAFDAVYKGTAALLEMKREHSLTPEALQSAKQALADIDSVLRIID